MALLPGDQPVNRPRARTTAPAPKARTANTFSPQQHQTFLNHLGINTQAQNNSGSIFQPAGTQSSANSYKAWDPNRREYFWDTAPDNPTLPGPAALPQLPPSGGGGRGGGGGGGGAPAIDSASILALMGKRPQQYQWQNLDIPDYQAREFYAFNEQPYQQAHTGLDQGLAADLKTGNEAYAGAGAELANYKNPFAGADYATNPAMSDSMQRMLAANNVAPDAATQGQGVQADAAFGNVMALMGGAAGQQQASAQRALAGDQRRFGESIANEGRNLGLGIDMARSRALDQYQKDKWQYGEEVARMNYNTNMQEAQANNAGQNQVSQANVAGANTFDQSNAQTLIQMLASGAKIDPALIQQFLGSGG